MAKLRLVRPEKKHEEQAFGYLEEFYADGSETHGVGGLERYRDNYDGWLEKLAADRIQKPNEERVPAETFFLMKDLSDQPMGFGDDAERLVGMINIRLALNHALWNHGGNIGYSIRPSERKRGYNKINLYLALKVCQNHGIGMVLLDCDKENIGSSKTMLAVGGKFLYEHPYHGENGKDIILQWYGIDVDYALEKYASQYDPYISEYPSQSPFRKIH